MACLAGRSVAAPEEDRAQFISLYRGIFPTIPLESYVNGALMLSSDAMSQFDSIMEFPPFQGDIDRGRNLWEAPFRSGKTFASCFAGGGRNVAGNYPFYDPDRDKVVTFEMEINRCLRDNGEAEYKFNDKATMGTITAYARTLSDGMRVNVRVAGAGGLAKYEQGKKLYFTRIGQYNFACASCHMANAGKILRTEILSPSIGQTTHWPVFRGGDNLNTLHMRYRRCMEQMRAAPFPAGSEELNNLEYFHSYLSNGLPMRASVYRK
ncbi:MAG: sulfur oxidation c-type cytochrome SoxA [Prolixibacteraceae bacterium]|nr:sulfur oxidation c-type cytochrome SoxA [Burkholderiales bacterium]